MKTGIVPREDIGAPQRVSPGGDGAVPVDLRARGRRAGHPPVTAAVRRLLPQFIAPQSLPGIGRMELCLLASSHFLHIKPTHGI